MKKYVKDFIEGRVEPRTFITESLENPEVLNWIQTIIPEGATFDKAIRTQREDGLLDIAIEKGIPYDIHDEWEERKFYGIYTTGEMLNIHHTLTRFYSIAFPNEELTPDNSIEERFVFFLETVPEYIGGEEIDSNRILESLYESLPEGLGKTKMKKMFKDMVKEKFHIEGRKYPFWLQSPEWPLGKDNEPMKYVSSKGNMQMKTYIFEDVKTAEKKEIVQFT